MTTVNIVDVIILFFLCWGGYKGFRKGFMTEFLSTLIFLGCVLLFFKLLQMGFEAGGQTMDTKFHKSIPFIIFILIFAGLSVGLNIFGKKRMDRGDGLQVFDTFDSLMGMVIGILKYAIGLGILFWLLTAVGLIKPSDGFNGTLFYPRLMTLFNETLEVLSRVFTPLGNMIDGIRRLLR